MGKSISQNSPKIEVKRCKFDTDSLISLNMVKNRDFMTVDMKSQKFNFAEKISFSSLFFLVSSLALTAVIAAIAFIIFTMKSKKGEESGSVAEIKVFFFFLIVNSTFTSNTRDDVYSGEIRTSGNAYSKIEYDDYLFCFNRSI